MNLMNLRELPLLGQFHLPQIVDVSLGHQQEGANDLYHAILTIGFSTVVLWIVMID